MILTYFCPDLIRICYYLMKLKFLILISSLLILPLTSGEIFNTQPLENITSKVEEESYADITTPIFEDITIEDGGNFGSEALFQPYVGIQQVKIPVQQTIGSFSNITHLNQTPNYIKYCRLKIACKF